MEPVKQHSHTADASFDGGSLDCGSGLLLLIRRHIDPLDQGQLLEIRSTDPSVQVELPAWCRMTGNELVSWTKNGSEMSFLVSKGRFVERQTADMAAGRVTEPVNDRSMVKPITIPDKLPAPQAAPAIAPLAVMGIGSWPRPRWMLEAVHDHLRGRLGEEEYQSTADDAVRLAVDAQVRAGVDVLTDGEQRRDSYASFVGALLDNCQLIPLSDLVTIAEDPEHFEQELRALDVPAAEVRHPVVYGPLGRSRSLAVHEASFLRTLTEKPIKVALPGPYLLTRTMWMECITDRAYGTRELLATDVVRVLREELHFLLAAGVSLVQFDEPVLSEVVFAGAKNTRSFMCGALSARENADRELDFARELINAVVSGLPRERTALHMCRGNWTKDETVALSGDYRPLLGLLSSLQVGTLFLELCTPRAGDMGLLATIPDDMRMGIGVVNQKRPDVETVDEIVARAEKAVNLFGADRVLLTPDCGFATFADNPVTSVATAERKLAAIAEAARMLCERYVL